MFDLDFALSFGECFFSVFFSCAGFAIVALFAELIVFLFRCCFSRRFWCVTFFQTDDIFGCVVSSRFSLFMPPNSSDHYVKERLVWFETELEALSVKHEFDSLEVA